MLTGVVGVVMSLQALVWYIVINLIRKISTFSFPVIVSFSPISFSSAISPLFPFQSDLTIFSTLLVQRQLSVRHILMWQFNQREPTWLLIMYLPGVKFAFCSQSCIDLWVGRSTQAGAEFAYQVGEPPSIQGLATYFVSLLHFFRGRLCSYARQEIVWGTKIKPAVHLL